MSYEPRFDFGPLEREARRDLAVTNTQDVARCLGVARTSVKRYRTEGVPFWMADRLACALNCHPLELWPDFDDWKPDPMRAHHQRRARAYRAAKKAA